MINDINDIPQSWRDVLAAIQAMCPSAVMAGGCLRDRDNGRAVKDIDLFIRVGGMSCAEHAIYRLRESGFEVDAEFTDTTAYPEDQNLEVVLVADVAHSFPNCPPVQLIFVNWDTDRIVERFDYGICRIAFDGTTVTRAPEYLEDQQAKVFRLCRPRPTPVSMRGSIHRYARLSLKYEGWTWWPYEQSVEEALPLFT